MSELKSRADLFEAAAKMMRMCDEAGIKHTCKNNGMLISDAITLCFDAPAESYEFPLAIVEGKPVFKGDELYSTRTGFKYIAGVDRCDFTVDWSWLPPKPRTVMVELLREDAEIYAGCTVPMSSYERVKDACRKALEELK